MPELSHVLRLNTSGGGLTSIFTIVIPTLLVILADLDAPGHTTDRTMHTDLLNHSQVQLSFFVDVLYHIT